MRMRRWLARTFLTRTTPALYNRHAGKVLTVDEWERGGGWAGALVPGVEVSRPDWWTFGGRSGVRAETREEALVRLDAWQDGRDRLPPRLTR